MRKLPLGCRETWKDRWSDHGRSCFQSKFSMNWFLLRWQSCGAVLHISCDETQPSSSAKGPGIPLGHSLGVCLLCSRMEQLLEKYLYCSQKHSPVLYSLRSDRGPSQLPAVIRGTLHLRAPPEAWGYPTRRQDFKYRHVKAQSAHQMPWTDAPALAGETQRIQRAFKANSSSQVSQRPSLNGRKNSFSKDL